MDALLDYQLRCAQLQNALAQARAAGQPVRLRKDTSNLFRPVGLAARSLDVRSLNHVLRIDPGRRLAEVEGMLTYEDFVRETLAHNLLPAVVPQLKTITVGGAVSGLGIESSSLRYGLVHETAESMEVLLSDGRVVRCSPGENADLFFGLPNSYGTLGYVLKLTLRLVPARKFVHLTHIRFHHPEPFLERLASSNAEFADGTIFGHDEMYVTEATSVDHAQYVSDYTYRKIYYQSIRARFDDWLTTHDYIWRWDTDWFWCSRQFGLQNPWVRWMAQPWLNSRTYQRWMRLAQRWYPGRGETESVIQDVQIPVEHAETFFRFLLAKVPITPVWACPFQTFNTSWTLCPLQPRGRYINFGFWDVLPSQNQPDYFNRLIEDKVLELGGTKALYSTSRYDPATFWEIYDRPRYERLKDKYDPDHVFPNLYAKATGNESATAPSRKAAGNAAAD